MLLCPSGQLAPKCLNGVSCSVLVVLELLLLLRIPVVVVGGISHASGVGQLRLAKRFAIEAAALARSATISQAAAAESTTGAAESESEAAAAQERAFAAEARAEAEAAELTSDQTRAAVA